MTTSPRVDVTHHRLTANGLDQHYVTAGQGPPVVLLHGFPEFWYAWRHQIPVLAQSYTVIAPDLRGYGYTEKPNSGYDKRTMAADIRALMATLGHGRAAVIGHDRGARVALAVSNDRCESWTDGIAMPRYAPNKMPAGVKRQYFELIRTGISGSVAAQTVGVSLSCGSLWFIDAGSVRFVDTPISSRYLTQDDRIEIADGLNRGERVKDIAERIGKTYQSVYREIARNRKPDGTYQPWYAHGQAYQRRRRPKTRRLAADDGLRMAVAKKLSKRWSPVQISRWLRRRYRRRPAWHLCAETIYEGVYRGLVVDIDQAARNSGKSINVLRTGRIYRHRRGRGRSRDGALKQLTKLRSIHDRPASVESRRQVGHWEGDLIVGTQQRSAVATLVERKMRLTLLIRLPYGHSAQHVGDALITTFTQLPVKLRRTLTWDQGNEMFHHERIEAATGLKIYFADPHSPWQRGSNENTNGLVRQYLPKGTDLSVWDDVHLRQIAHELNDRPRLCLNDKTPAELLQRWERQYTLH